MAKVILATFGIDVDSVSGWLGSGEGRLARRPHETAATRRCRVHPAAAGPRATRESDVMRRSRPITFPLTHGR
jgi:hypothetical protein